MFEFRYVARAAILGVGLFLLACGPNTAFLAERSRTEAHVHLEQCEALKLNPPEVIQGKALLQESDRLFKEGEDLSAHWAAEEAISNLELALQRHASEQQALEAKAVADALTKDQERLATYREILEEMRAVRKP